MNTPTTPTTSVWPVGVRTIKIRRKLSSFDPADYVVKHFSLRNLDHFMLSQPFAEQWTSSKGTPLCAKYSSFTDRFYAPLLAKRFLWLKSRTPDDSSQSRELSLKDTRKAQAPGFVEFIFVKGPSEEFSRVFEMHAKACEPTLENALREPPYLTLHTHRITITSPAISGDVDFWVESTCALNGDWESWTQQSDFFVACGVRASSASHQERIDNLLLELGILPNDIVAVPSKVLIFSEVTEKQWLQFLKEWDITPHKRRFGCTVPDLVFLPLKSGMTIQGWAANWLKFWKSAGKDSTEKSADLCKRYTDMAAKLSEDATANNIYNLSVFEFCMAAVDQLQAQAQLDAATLTYPLLSTLLGEEGLCAVGALYFQLHIWRQRQGLHKSVTLDELIKAASITSTTTTTTVPATNESPELRQLLVLATNADLAVLQAMVSNEKRRKRKHSTSRSRNTSSSTPPLTSAAPAAEVSSTVDAPPSDIADSDALMVIAHLVGRQRAVLAGLANDFVQFQRIVHGEVLFGV